MLTCVCCGSSGCSGLRLLRRPDQRPPPAQSLATLRAVSMQIPSETQCTWIDFKCTTGTLRSRGRLKLKVTMPQVSRSPKRKRVRRYFSASAATGTRWNPKLLSSSGPSSSAKRRRRSSSVSSDDTFDLSPGHIHDRFHSEEDLTLRYSRAPNSYAAHDNDAESSQLPRPPLAYASLPPTPISPSPPLQPTSPISPSLPSFPNLDMAYEPPFSLWDYLREELLATDFDSHQELKWERVSNFLSMPIAMEKVS